VEEWVESGAGKGKTEMARVLAALCANYSMTKILTVLYRMQMQMSTTRLPLLV
jgi:hypothetical protein